MATGVQEFVLKGFREGTTETAMPEQEVLDVVSTVAGPYAPLFRIGAGFLFSLAGRWIGRDKPEPSPRTRVLDTPTHPTRWVFGGLVRVPLWLIYHGEIYINQDTVPAIWAMNNNLDDADVVSVFDLLLWIGEGKNEQLLGMFINEDYIHFTPQSGRLFPLHSQKYTGHLLAQDYLGVNAGPTNLYNRYNTGTAPINSRSIESGHSYFHLQLNDFVVEEDTFWLKEGIPQGIDAVVKGNLCFDLTASDPENAPRVWTNNAASVWYTIERDCHQEPANGLDLNSFREAYNICEHVITNDYSLYDSQTSAALSVGQLAENYYRNHPKKSRRYTASIIINSGDNPRVTRERLALAMCGSHTISNGKLVVFAGASRQPKAHIRDEDVLEGTIPTRYTQQRAENKSHVLEVTYISQADGMKEKTIVVKDAAAIARDNGLEVRRQIELDCTDDTEVRRKARQILESQRYEETLGIMLLGDRTDFIPGEYLDVSLTSLSIDRKPYRVINKSRVPALDATKIYLKEAPVSEFRDDWELPPLARRDLNEPEQVAIAADGQDGKNGVPGWAKVIKYRNYKPAAGADLNSDGDYKFSTNADSALAGIEDFEDLNTATHLHVNMNDSDGADIQTAISGVVGRGINYFVNNDRWYFFTVSTTPTNSGEVWTIPIEFQLENN